MSDCLFLNVIFSFKDPYPAEVASTVHAVMKELNHSNPYRLIWQSQVGPQPWLGPKTETVIADYGKKGISNQLVVPIAFVSDHVETLYEVDIEYGELAKKVTLIDKSTNRSQTCLILAQCQRI